MAWITSFWKQYLFRTLRCKVHLNICGGCFGFELLLDRRPANAIAKGPVISTSSHRERCQLSEVHTSMKPTHECDREESHGCAARIRPTHESPPGGNGQGGLVITCCARQRRITRWSRRML